MEGLGLALESCRELVIIESDCSRVVSALQSTKTDALEYSFVIQEVKEYAQMLREWKIVQVKRECNRVAHELASLAKRNTHT